MAPRLILVIEDDEGIRETLRLTLELEGFDVITAANGKLGLDALKEHKPCLILLDLMMPVMDGWAFADALEKDADLASIPIVVVTAVAESAKNVKLARGVIKKPVDMDVLLKIVGQYC
jgi:CheY-like chemotaxis protein